MTEALALLEPLKGKPLHSAAVDAVLIAGRISEDAAMSKALDIREKYDDMLLEQRIRLGI